MAIRPKTEPKNAAPRSGVPKGDLEQYGVWVKAEPQDIVEEAAPPSVDFDFDIPVESPSAEESFLSADEEKLLDSFDSEFDAPKPDSGANPDLSALPSIDEMPTIESSLLDEAPSAKSDEIEELGSSTIDISLEDIDSLHRVSPIRPNPEMDLSEIEELDGATPAPQMEDVSMEFLEAEPAAPADHPSSSEFESLDIDLHFDDTIPHQEEDAAASSVSAFEEVTEFDDFLSKDESGQKEAAPPPFDDLAAVERDLSESPAPAAPAKATAARASSPDLSTEILLKIAQELSSIRGELISLKTQLGDLRREAEAGAAMEPPPSLDKESSDSRAGGFFDEEEDETIALTGDELDNILNTADFTEESAEAEASAVIEAAEPPLIDNSLLSDNLLPESGDYSATPADLPAIEEINLAEDGSIETASQGTPATADVSADFGEIGLMAEEGVTPITSAPDDTSYLEADRAEASAEILVEEPLSSADGFGDLGLENVPLVEPDLTDFETEELEAEPIDEIEEELPLVEEAELLEPDMALQSIAEAEPVEIRVEADHSNMTGIDLHEESQAPIPEIETLVDIEDLPEAEAISSLSDEIPASLDDSLFVEEKSETLADEAAISEPIEEVPIVEVAPLPRKAAERATPEPRPSDDSDRLKTEIRSVLSYLDKLLDSLPEEKIEEFARSEHFDTYKRLFEELGLV